MKRQDVLTRKFWGYSEKMLDRLHKEPEQSVNKQLVPEGYYKHGYVKTETDYWRALESLPFRSLQDKTQVFPLDREYHVRSRLTHSYEVAVNASQIFEEMIARAKTENERSSNRINGELKESELSALRFALQAACLLHDVGNPPFGHFGETVIRNWFQDYVCKQGYEGEYWNDLNYFEGNANSLRMALRGTGLYDGRRMNPTLLTLKAMVKYPCHSGQAIKNDPHHVKYNFFESDRFEIERLIKESEECVEGGSDDSEDTSRSSLSLVMEAADDISYLTSDFEDAFRKGLFSISEIVEFLLERWRKASKSKDRKPGSSCILYDSKARQNTFSLIFLLALMAGTPADYEAVQRFIGQNKDLGKYLIAVEGNLEKQYASFLLPNAIVDGATAESMSSHTFMAALRDTEKFEMDAWQKRQMQDTYVGRWVDVVRKWLCFSSAHSLCSLDPDATIDDAARFGGHLMTVDLLRSVLEYYVYDSQENIKMNTHAETVLRGLLDKLIPAVEECAKLDNPENASPVNPHAVSSTARALILRIPLRYRIDFQEHYIHSSQEWDVDRMKYELDMMAMDFISSLPDDYAIRLYNELY